MSEFKRVALTGATGPLGIALAAYLAGRGVSVTAIVNPDSGRLGWLPVSDRIEIVPCGLAELASLEGRLAQGHDAFFHLGWSGTENRAARNDPAGHARNILHALDAVKLARAIGCTTFVGAGSQVEMAGIAADVPVDREESYGIAKYAAGRLAAKLCEQLGMRHCWGRVMSIYGPGERETTALMYCIDTLLKGEKPSLTAGEQLWDYLYSVDCARAFHLIAQRGRHGATYDVGSGSARPLSEYFRITRDCIDASLPLGLGDRPYPPGQPMRLCGDVRPLTEDTGFAPQYSFETGIRETIDWVVKERRPTPQGENASA